MRQLPEGCFWRNEMNGRKNRTEFYVSFNSSRIFFGGTAQK